jgi:hypothetical protein
LIRLLIAILLTASVANAVERTVIHHGPVSATLAADPAPFASCQPLADYQAFPTLTADSFYILPGATWSDSIVIEDENGAAIDYSGLDYIAEFSALFPVWVLLDIETTVIERYVSGVVSVEWRDVVTFQGRTYGKTVVAPSGYSGETPVYQQGNTTNGVKAWIVSRQELFSSAETPQAIPINPVITATPTKLAFSLTAAQTAGMEGWNGIFLLNIPNPSVPSKSLSFGFPMAVFPTTTRIP